MQEEQEDRKRRACHDVVITTAVYLCKDDPHWRVGADGVPKELKLAADKVLVDAIAELADITPGGVDVFIERDGEFHRIPWRGVTPYDLRWTDAPDVLRRIVYCRMITGQD